MKKKQDDTIEVLGRIYDYTLEEIMGDRFGQYAKDIIQNLKVGMIIETEIIDGKLHSPILLIDESNKKLEEMNSRLNNLFKRKKQGQ